MCCCCCCRRCCCCCCCGYCTLSVNQVLANFEIAQTHTHSLSRTHTCTRTHIHMDTHAHTHMDTPTISACQIFIEWTCKMPFRIIVTHQRIHCLFQTLDIFCLRLDILIMQKRCFPFSILHFIAMGRFVISFPVHFVLLGEEREGVREMNR